MGFAWVATSVVIAWASFKLGRKYQDLQDIMLAKRVAKLIQQRTAVQADLRDHTSNEELLQQMSGRK